MSKKYDLIPEIRDLGGLSDIIEAGDMGGLGVPKLLALRSVLYMLAGLLGPTSIGILIYKVFFARESDVWWLTALTVLASVYVNWLVIRLFIRWFLQIRLRDPNFEWRPGGSYTMMNTRRAVMEGRIPFTCPHCVVGRHTYTVHLERLHIKSAGYIPSFFDPINPTHLEYHRKLRVPLTCPTTGLTFQGTFVNKQCSLNAVLRVEVIGIVD